MPGPSNLPTTKYDIAETAKEPARKWTKMNMSASLTTLENAGVYARDQANEVRRRKKEKR